ncbi:ribonuclease R [Candidatus Latescibacterota bacterium]
MNEKILIERIVDTIKSSGGRKFRRRELFGLVKDKSMDYMDFKSVLTRLENSGTIVRIKGRKYTLPEQSGVFTGIFTSSRNGNGSVRFPGGESVFISRGNVGNALSGDIVQVKILKKKRVGLSRTAEIMKIIERSTKPVIGIVRKHGGTEYLIPSGKEYPGNILVRNSQELDTGDGDLVVCRMEMPFKGFSKPVCVITEVLGDPDTPGVDIVAIAKRYELPLDFPEEVIRECKNIPSDLGPELFGSRRDIRDLVTFTIDPDDAKDYDDAISISRLDDCGYELGVHIADVSHYVKEDSAIDLEAQFRAMSCYLVDRVIPMLPERLSNDLCSLKPKEDRLTKSVFATLDKNGNIIKSEISNTVINSSMRLTYNQVQAYLDGNETDGAEQITPEVGKALKNLSELSDLFIEIRNKRGSLDMELPEAKVILDDKGRPVNIIKLERIKANRVIEEAMLLANTVTAEMLAMAQVPFLYRIHDKPDREKLAAFGEIVEALGYKFNVNKAKNQEYIQSFLMSIQGTPYARTFNEMLLRSMKKAAYSPENIGHFGLALKKYTHFTSPIRRYPDIITHRQLDTYVLGNNDGLNDKNFKYYINLGIHATQREIITDSVERDSIKMKTAEFMKKHLGEEFDGTISGIIPKGIFVELETFFIEGLIHVSSLEDDYYEIDSTGVAMTGRNRGRRYMIGDRLKVIVASANKEYGEVDFVVAEQLKREKKKRK